MEIQQHRLLWRDIDIEFLYYPNKWNALAHLEIRSLEPKGVPLPITKTAYLSHHHPIGSIEALGVDVPTHVRGWLDEKAKSKEWIEFEYASRQGDLFA